MGNGASFLCSSEHFVFQKPCLVRALDQVCRPCARREGGVQIEGDSPTSVPDCGGNKLQFQKNSDHGAGTPDCLFP
jgi:hypothetical protein